MSWQDKEVGGQGVRVGTAVVQDIVPVLPNGVYVASFEGIEQASNENGEFWIWHFRAMPQAGGEVVEITATSSPRITPRTKAARFLQGLGVKVEVGVEIDFDELAPMPCNIVVEVNEYGYSRIMSVLPYTAPVKGKKE